MNRIARSSRPQFRQSVRVARTYPAPLRKCPTCQMRTEFKPTKLLIFVFGFVESVGPKSVEMPMRRWRRLSPMLASTSEKVSRRRFSAAWARASMTACECWPSVVAEASSQELEAFSRRVLYCSMASSLARLSCESQARSFCSRCAFHCSMSGFSCISRLTRACDTP